ncbi:hypothetical protein HK105_205503 [Polyrhizophydium stewartii]|uniref:Cwf19-like C-terminal domain-containing protein n=1 Tax=Polyrhizophydium stewartii TaxID=2732419 RepID=A0ABR4N674_9FUNG
MKALVVGPLGGNLRAGLARVAAMNGKSGPFAVLIVVGDFFGPDQDQQLADLEALLDGSLKLPMPTYCMAGTFDLAPKIVDLVERTEGQLTDSLTFLGPSGVVTMPDKLKLAFLGGHFDHEAFTRHPSSMPDGAPHPNKMAQTRFSRGDIQRLINSVPSRPAASDSDGGAERPPHGVDILITHNWPDSIAAASPSAAAVLGNRRISRGVRAIADVVSALAPRYHFASGEMHATRFIGLGWFGSADKMRWFYAMSIEPMATMDPEKLRAIPPGATPCPLPPPTSQRTSKRPPEPPRAGNAGGEAAAQDGEGGNFFWGSQDRDSKRRRGHDADGPGSRGRGGGRGRGRGGRFNDAIAQRDERLCWFCTSNEKLEAHLILNVFDKVYITLAKGGLVSRHILIVPITHFPSTRIMQLEDGEAKQDAQETLAELARVLDRIRDKEREQGHCLVAFEVFAGGDMSDPNERLYHLHVQVVPIPVAAEHRVRESFVAEAEQQGLDCLDELPESPKVPYMRVHLPDKSILVLAPSDERIADFEKLQAEQQPESVHQGRRAPRHVGLLFNLQAGRAVVAGLLGTPDRADWKRCVLPMAEEEKLAESVKPFYDDVFAESL